MSFVNAVDDVKLSTVQKGNTVDAASFFVSRPPWLISRTDSNWIPYELIEKFGIPATRELSS
jgi:hypothetical protein